MESGGAPKQAIVLAAGEARRLRPLTHRRPKGMLLVGGRPLLQHLVQALKESGVEKVVLVIGEHGEKIQAFFKDGADFGVRIDYAHQTRPTGTADALRAAIPLIDAEQPAIVLPGDNYLTPDTLKNLLQRDDTALLIGRPPHTANYGVPKIRDGLLAGLSDQRVDDPQLNVSTGVLKIANGLLPALQDEEHAQTNDLDAFLDAYARTGGRIHAVTNDEAPWDDITHPWDVLRLNERILEAQGKDQVHVDATATIAPTARLIPPVSIGPGCSIGDFTVLGPYVTLRTNSSVGSHCEVRRSILNNNVQLESRSLLRGSILDDGVTIGPGFACHEDDTRIGPVGCIIGHDATVGPDCRAAAGTLLEPNASVPAATRLEPQGGDA